MKNQSKFREVRNVLLESWDPIGILDAGGPQDEYDAYIPGVERLLEKGVLHDDLARYLSEIAARQMGLIDDEARGRATAERLLKLGLQ